MINQCSQQDSAEIITYIGNDYPYCLYLYLDLIQYGFDSQVVNVYTQRIDGSIAAVLLKYYSCVHVFSKNNVFDAYEIARFIEKTDVTVVYTTVETAKRLYTVLSDELQRKSVITEGWVSRINNVDKAPEGFARLAEKKDFIQIAELIYGDKEIGKLYKFDELSRQLIERNQEGYARNYVIKDNDTVVAHACTNAEIGNIAIVAELLVRKEYRRKGYASEIWRDICNQLLSEGKEVYSFYFSDESRNLHKKIGFSEICEWAKIVIE